MNEKKDEQARAWIEGGKQVGKNLCIERDGHTFYLRVAVQKRRTGYTVIVDEIDQARVATEEYARDERRGFDSLEAARRFIEETTPVRLDELQPSKGQPWF